jgi:hypothetical protein
MLPLGALLAKTYKTSKKKVGDSPLWFGGHRLLQSLGVVFQIIGFVCIAFFKGNEQFVGPGQAHMWIGLVVVILGVLNPIVAVLRPHVHAGEEKTVNRKRWEILHKYVIGWPAVCFGFINCIIACVMLGIDYSFNIALLIVAGCFLIISIGFLFVVYRKAPLALEKKGTEPRLYEFNVQSRIGGQTQNETINPL